MFDKVALLKKGALVAQRLIMDGSPQAQHVTCLLS